MYGRKKRKNMSPLLRKQEVNAMKKATTIRKAYQDTQGSGAYHCRAAIGEPELTNEEKAMFARMDMAKLANKKYQKPVAFRRRGY
jgi:hypothetical protein